MNRAVVLLIEDEETEQIALKREMRGTNVSFLSAFTEGEARNLIKEHSSDGSLHVDAVIINACLGTHALEVSTGLVSEVRGRFNGPVIATSMEERFQGVLRQAGCQYACDHDSLPEMLRQVLGI
jgi:hypothetical protein